MDITKMDTPDTREEFERRMNIMHYYIRHGKLMFQQGMTTIVESICDLHTMPNGRVDLLTVNEAARLQVNMMVQFGDEILDIEKNEDE